MSLGVDGRVAFGLPERGPDELGAARVHSCSRTLARVGCGPGVRSRAPWRSSSPPGQRRRPARPRRRRRRPSAHGCPDGAVRGAAWPRPAARSELLGELAGGLGALGRVFLQAPHDHPFDAGGTSTLGLASFMGIGALLRWRGQKRHLAAAKRQGPGQELVEHDAGRVEVTPPVEREPLAVLLASPRGSARGSCKRACQPGRPVAGQLGRSRRPRRSWRCRNPAP